MEKNYLLEKILPAALALTFFLIPAFFLPDLSPETGKKAIIVFATIVVTIIFLINSAVKNRLIFTLSPFTLPLGLLSLSLLASYLVNNQNPENLPSIFTFLSLFLIFIIGSHLRGMKTARTLTVSLIISSLVTALLSILKLPLFANSLLQNLPPASALTGSTPVNVIVTAAGLPLVLGLLTAFKSQSKIRNLLLSAFLFLALGLAAALFHLKSSPPTALPYEFGWNITISEIAVNFPKNLLFGTGPETFETVFTRFKPLSLNATPLWNTRFTVSSNEILEVLATGGILGFLSLCLLIVSILKTAKTIFTKKNTPEIIGPYLSVLAMAILFFLIPFTPTLYFLLFSLLAIVTIFLKEQNKTTDFALSVFAIERIEDQKTPPRNRFPFLLLPPAVIIGLILSLIFIKIVLADRAFSQSLKKLSQNQALDTYNLQAKAIRNNPNKDLYHLVFSQTNLALANSLAQKPNLTDSDRRDISVFIQQAISEAKRGTSISPQKASTWENLARLYKNIINFAQGADQWAISSYLEAIRNDPLNPALRVDLAGVYMLKQDFEAAARELNLAISLKPDYANAHYNLAYTLKAQNRNTESLNEMETARTLVCNTNPSSNDCTKVQNELANLQSKPASPSAEASPSAKLKTQVASDPLTKTATASDTLKKAASPKFPPLDLGTPSAGKTPNPTAIPRPTTP